MEWKNHAGCSECCPNGGDGGGTGKQLLQESRIDIAQDNGRSLKGFAVRGHCGERPSGNGGGHGYLGEHVVRGMDRE